MLSISLYGSIRQRKKLEDFACDVCNHLFRNNEPNCHINLRFKDKLDAYGYCNPPSDNIIDIEVRKDKDLRTIALTIAHELVHARQFITESDVCEVEAEKLEYELVDLLWT